MKRKWLSWDVTRQEKVYNLDKDMDLLRRFLNKEFEAKLTKTPEGGDKYHYRTLRKNWGIMYNCLKRLYTNGDIHAYWFYRSGELKLTWKCDNTIKKIEQKQLFRAPNINHNVNGLYRPSYEHDKDKRVHKQQYATFRASTSIDRPDEMKTFPRFTIDVLNKIKYDNFIKKKDQLEAEANKERGGTCYNWDDVNSQVMSKKYDIPMVFWRSTEELKRINKEKRT